MSSHSPSPAGFRASLSGTSLFDLIQMQCNRRDEGCVEVQSHGRVGYVYFGGGQMVHAEVEDAVGESALFAILRWTDGDVFAVDRPAPGILTIRCTWQDALMRAAQMEDEEGRGVEGADVVPLRPARNRSSSGVIPTPAPRVGLLDGADTSPPRPPMSEEPSPPESPGVHDYARTDAGGAIARGHGNSAWMHQTGSYVTRLGELIGDSLGLEGFTELDAVVGLHRLVVCSGPLGTVTLRGEASATAQSLLRSAE